MPTAFCIAALNALCGLRLSRAMPLIRSVRRSPMRSRSRILSADQIADVLSRLDDHPLHPIVALALGTGTAPRRAVRPRLGCVDLDAATVRVERSLEETEAGLRFKQPKTRHGRRTSLCRPRRSTCCAPTAGSSLSNVCCSASAGPAPTILFSLCRMARPIRRTN